MLANYLATESSLNQLQFQTNMPLAPHSTFGIGGLCDYFISPLNQNAFLRLLTFLRTNGIRHKVIGNASNILFDDNGFRGCIISTKQLKRIEQNGCTLNADAGCSLIALSSYAASLGLSGLEFACSIPATLGGAVYMNAGAYGSEMSKIVTTCQVLRSDGVITEIKNHDFSYRHSRYQSSNEIILSATLSLTPSRQDDIYRLMKENKDKRMSSQPIKEKSAGSTFRRGDGIIPAKLIDEAGLKGLTCGGACVSEKHAGFIVNRNHATAKDVLRLIKMIRDKIREKYGCELICEISYIPE